MQRTLRTNLKTIETMESPQEAHRLKGLHSHIVVWAQSAKINLDPKLPKILRGRAADNWRVLIAIADSFQSAEWSKAAREAAIAFANGFYDEDAAVALLYDIRTVFRRLKVDRIKGAILMQELQGLEDGVGIWNAWRGENDDHAPHPIMQGEIASLLRRFDRNTLRPKPLAKIPTGIPTGLIRNECF